MIEDMLPLIEGVVTNTHPNLLQLHDDAHGVRAQATCAISRISGKPSVQSRMQSTRCHITLLLNNSFENQIIILKTAFLSCRKNREKIKRPLPPFHYIANSSIQTRVMQQKQFCNAKLTFQEQVLAVGRGFDWLHLPNKALIVGPYR